MVSPRRRFWLPSLLIRRRALARGVFGDNTLWRVVAAILFGMSMLKRIFRGGEEIVTVERMRPGETMVLRTIAPVPRRGRRRTARAK
jgi:hypothetical protein